MSERDERIAMVVEEVMKVLDTHELDYEDILLALTASQQKVMREYLGTREQIQSMKKVLMLADLDLVRSTEGADPLVYVVEIDQILRFDYDSGQWVRLRSWSEVTLHDVGIPRSEEKD